MRIETLTTVARLRRLACDHAQRELAHGVVQEAAAEAAVKEANSCIERETALASDPEGDDAVVEAFAAWLPSARLRAIEVLAAHERAAAEVARLRAVLTASRSAAEAVEALLSERRAERAERQARRAQDELDEARPPNDAGLAPLA